MTVFYVEKGAAGANNGSSWANAWNGYSQVNLATIKASAPPWILVIGGGPAGSFKQCVASLAVNE